MSVELELQFEQLSDEFDAWGNILTSLSLNRKKLYDERIRLRTLGLVSLSMSNPVVLECVLSKLVNICSSLFFFSGVSP